MGSKYEHKVPDFGRVQRAVMEPFNRRFLRRVLATRGVPMTQSATMTIAELEKRLGALETRA